MTALTDEICMPCNPAHRWIVDHTRCLRYRAGSTYACGCPDKYHENPKPPDAYRGPMPQEWPAAR